MSIMTASEARMESDKSIEEYLSPEVEKATREWIGNRIREATKNGTKHLNIEGYSPSSDLWPIVVEREKLVISGSLGDELLEKKYNVFTLQAEESVAFPSPEGMYPVELHIYWNNPA